MTTDAIIATSCARCGVAFSSKPDGFVDEALENEVVEHAERCFMIGDRVRTENTPILTGVIAVLTGELCVVESGGNRLAYGTSALRRITRPAQPATVHVPVCCGKPMRKTGMGNGWICEMRTGGSWCERFEGPQGARTPAQWWRHGEDRVPAWQRALGPVYLPGQPQTLAVLPPCPNCGKELVRPAGVGPNLFCCGYNRSKGCWWTGTIQDVERLNAKLADEVAPAESVAPTSPTLIDGLTADQCLARWMLRRTAIESPIVQGYFDGDADGQTKIADLVDGTWDTKMTPAQMTAARELWQSQLRAKLAASREAERVSVVVDQYDVDDLPW